MTSLGFMGRQRLVGWIGYWAGQQKPALNLLHRYSALSFGVSICPSVWPSSISAVLHESPEAIKFHGALPDGIFSHFPSPPGTV